MPRRIKKRPTYEGKDDKEYVPVQAYIPEEHYYTFLKRFRKQGSITRFIREAFERICTRIEEEESQSEQT